jgi:cytidyltransferase-like protein
MNNKIVLVSGGYDPIHSGHIEYFKSAKKLGDYLVVAINSDRWLERKKGASFMSWGERSAIIAELSMVDEVIKFDDSDDTAIDAIHTCLEKFPESALIFANGGDRTNENTPEFLAYCDESRVNFEWGVGGFDKKNSSSSLLENWKSPKTNRNWGWYRVLDDKKNVKVKELIIKPGGELSMQRHFQRSEHWYVLTGGCTLHIEDLHQDGERLKIDMTENETFVIPVKTWHQAVNYSDKACHILEVQYGAACVEDDIERR